MDMKNKTIYVLTVANVATGGIELCHQLVYKLNLLGFHSIIVYLKRQWDLREIDRMQEYDKYHCPYVTELPKDKEAYYIIPEGMGNYFKEIKYPNKIFWWLSVNNLVMEKLNEDQIIEWFQIPHLVQSEYARQFVEETIGISKEKIFFLSDYINSEYLTNETSQVERENIVLFNPRKGANESALLFVNSNGKIMWQALRGLSPREMRQVMAKAKVYIDFGNHPGKDRIPREAALQGLCVITNRKGSANNPFDVEIPEKYKYEELEVIKILDQIYELCDQYEIKKNDFASYIEKTKKEYQVFECELYAFFGTLFGMNWEKKDENELIELIKVSIEAEDYNQALEYLVRYRIQYNKDSLSINILETYIRLGIGELFEAKYTAFEALKKDEDSYKAYMLLSQISFYEGNKEKQKYYKERALQLSEHTKDEESVRNYFENEVLNSL